MAYSSVFYGDQVRGIAGLGTLGGCNNNSLVAGLAGLGSLNSLNNNSIAGLASLANLTNGSCVGPANFNQRIAAFRGVPVCICTEGESCFNGQILQVCNDYLDLNQNGRLITIPLRKITSVELSSENGSCVQQQRRR